MEKGYLKWIIWLACSCLIYSVAIYGSLSEMLNTECCLKENYFLKSGLYLFIFSLKNAVIRCI